MTEEHEEPERPKPRSANEIFDDLRVLAQSTGALHEISSIVYRDWVTTVDTREGKVIDDPSYRWSTDRLNQNELLLLLGLTVQSGSDQTYAAVVSGSDFVEKADRLLREFHDRVNVDARAKFRPESGTIVDSPDAIGLIAREAIYYGSQTFYLHQLRRFARERYRGDADWLLGNVGLSIRPMMEITAYIFNTISLQMDYVSKRRLAGEKFNNGQLTDSLLVSKAELRKKFGAKADAYIAKFVTPVTNANPGFIDPFAVNGVAIAPIIDMGENLYVPSQFRLFETLYESPFYWMMADKTYMNTAADHRGRFLEKMAADILRSVFGAANVYENVTIRQGAKDVDGEIDVLVIYGEFCLVVQTKSKRITLKARAGDTEALRVDFQGAVQDPYRQALECIDLMLAGAKCMTPGGKEITIPMLPRCFPVVVLSDSFPASALLSLSMLERGDGIAPVIWDIAILDCVARILPTPVEMIYYLKSRAEVFETIHSDSEHNYLGRHIDSKLVLEPGHDFMMLDRSYATPIDDFMMSADIGVEAERPVGIMERFDIPVISKLLAALKTADPKMASVVVDLYDFSSAMLEDVARLALQVRQEVTTTGKAIKAFSIPTATGGMTYAVVAQMADWAERSANEIGSKHKYDSKSDRWHVIIDSLETDNPVDALLMLVWPWEENEADTKASEQTGKMFGSRIEARTVGEASKEKSDAARPKVGDFLRGLAMPKKAPGKSEK